MLGMTVGRPVAMACLVNSDYALVGAVFSAVQALTPMDIFNKKNVSFSAVSPIEFDATFGVEFEYDSDSAFELQELFYKATAERRVDEQIHKKVLHLREVEHILLNGMDPEMIGDFDVGQSGFEPYSSLSRLESIPEEVDEERSFYAELQAYMNRKGYWLTGQVNLRFVRWLKRKRAKRRAAAKARSGQSREKVPNRKRTNGRTAKERLASLYGGDFHVTPILQRRIRFQSGVALAKHERAEKREERDKQQRKSAVGRDKAVYKALPKREREDKVRSQRDKRNPVFEMGFPPFGLLKRGLQVGGAFLGAKIAIGANKLINATRETVSEGSSFMRELKRLSRSVRKAIGNRAWRVPFVLIVWFALKQTGMSGPLLTLAIGAPMAAIIGHQLWDIISEFFRVGDDVDVHSEVEFQGFSGRNVAAELLVVLVTFSAIGQRLDARSVGEFVKRVSMFGRMRDGFEGFIDWVLKSTESIVNFVRERFGKNKIRLFNKEKQATYDWLSEVDSMLVGHATGQVDVDAEEINHIVSMMRKGLDFKEVYRGSPMAKPVEDAQMKLTNILMPYLGTINARNNFRKEPVCVCLVGTSGIGKTMMAMPFAASLLIKSGIIVKPTLDNVASAIWQKGNSPYWNSYCGHPCMVMDDAFQCRVVKGDPENDYMTLIRAVSSWSFPLNMADLPSKGKIFFGSSVIIASTNLRSFASEANQVIHEPDAVARRINFPYEIVLCPEFALPNGKLDYALFRQEKERVQKVPGLDGFPWHIWRVRTHNFLNGQPTSEFITMQALIELIASEMRARDSGHRAHRVELEDYINGLAAAQSAVPTLDSIEEQMGAVGVIDDVADPELAYFRQRVAAGDAEEFEAVVVDDNQASVFKNLLDGFNRVFHNFSEKVVAIWRQLSDNNNMAVVIPFLLAFGWSIQAYFRHMNRDNKKESSAFSPVEPMVWQSNRPLKSTPVSREAFPVFQGGELSVHNNIYANSYKLFWRRGPGMNEIAGQILFLESDLAVMPAHFTRRFTEGVKAGDILNKTVLTFKHVVQENHSFTMTVAKFLSLQRHTIEDHDVEFVRFQDVRAHRSISSNFVNENDVRHLSGKDAIMTLADVTEAGAMLPAVRSRYWALNKISLVGNLCVMGKKVVRAISYRAPTAPGDCGAPLCLMDNTSFSGRTCIGYHVAGDRFDNTGFSTVLTQEMIAAAKAILCVVVDAFQDDVATRNVGFQMNDEPPFADMGSFLAIGTVDKPNNLSPVSKLFPVKMAFGEFGHFSDLPAPMGPVWRDGVQIWPMVNAVAPYSTPLRILEIPHLEQAVHVAMSRFDEATMHAPRLVYTFEEAVRGMPQDKFRSIPRGTSAGYPYTREVTCGKKMFFGSGAEFEFTSLKCVELKERVAYVVERAKNNVRCAHIYADFLKDEIRSEEKVRDAKTRLISSPPLDYTIAWRQYFGAFSGAAMRHNITTGMAPGHSTYKEWYKIATFLSQKGPRVFDGDFKAFDASEQPGLMRFFLDFVNRWYDDGIENARIRTVLWEDLMHSRHLGGRGDNQRFVYQWCKSLPSGHPFTTIVNSMYSLTILVATYMDITKDLTGFWREVHAITYGDDNCANISDSVSDVYNQETVAEAVDRLFGMVYTPGRKDAVWKPYTSLQEITFLKRGFVLEDNTWLCPLELKSILQMCYWASSKKDLRAITAGNLENMLRELSHHDEEVWNTHVSVISKLLKQLECLPEARLERKAYRFLTFNGPDSYY